MTLTSPSSPSVISLDSEDGFPCPASPSLSSDTEEVNPSVPDNVQPTPIPPLQVSQKFSEHLEGKNVLSTTAPLHSTMAAINKTAQDHQADLIIIPSDGVSFMVQSFYLKAASRLIANKLSLHTDSSSLTLNFDDPAIERASVVRFWLDFIHGKIPQPEYQLLSRLRRAVLLAKKFNCELVLTAMRYFARLYLDDFETDSIIQSIFVIGSNLEDIAICSDAIRRGDENVWCGTDDGTTRSLEWYDLDKNGSEWELTEEEGAVHDESTMDPTTWDPEDIQQVPPRFLAALLRASRNPTNEERDWFEIATKFSSLLTPPKKVDKTNTVAQHDKKVNEEKNDGDTLSKE